VRTHRVRRAGVEGETGERPGVGCGASGPAPRVPVNEEREGEGPRGRRATRGSSVSLSSQTRRQPCQQARAARRKRLTGPAGANADQRRAPRSAMSSGGAAEVTVRRGAAAVRGSAAAGAAPAARRPQHRGGGGTSTRRSPATSAAVAINRSGVGPPAAARAARRTGRAETKPGQCAGRRDGRGDGDQQAPGGPSRRTRSTTAKRARRRLRSAAAAQAADPCGGAFLVDPWTRDSQKDGAAQADRRLASSMPASTTARGGPESRRVRDEGSHESQGVFTPVKGAAPGEQPGEPNCRIERGERPHDASPRGVQKGLAQRPGYREREGGRQDRCGSIGASQPRIAVAGRRRSCRNTSRRSPPLDPATAGRGVHQLQATAEPPPDDEEVRLTAWHATTRRQGGLRLGRSASRRGDRLSASRPSAPAMSSRYRSRFHRRPSGRPRADARRMPRCRNRWQAIERGRAAVHAEV